jgi:DNA-directed RNA polymerase subunit RPC12/RpoP
MQIDSHLKGVLQAKVPDTDFTRYFGFLESCSCDEHGERHHILPKTEFPEYKTHPSNIVRISVASHLYAHYWLAVCAPDCRAFQRAFFLMARVDHTDINASSLPEYAAVLKRGRLAQKQPWTRQRRRRQSGIATKVNAVENSKLRDRKCLYCGQEFKRVTKGEFGGHRRFCLHYKDKEVSVRPFVVLTSMKVKRCGKCGKEKLLDAFNVERKARLGRANYCRDCAHEHRKTPSASQLHDFVCPDCGRDFKQVKPGVYGGHRRSCLNYGARRQEFESWSGSAQEFANTHSLPLQTVRRWENSPLN